MQKMEKVQGGDCYYGPRYFGQERLENLFLFIKLTFTKSSHLSLMFIPSLPISFFFFCQYNKNYRVGITVILVLTEFLVGATMDMYRKY